MTQPAPTPPASPASNAAPVVPAGPDQRTQPPMLADERASLDAWLDSYRATALRKCEGLSADQLAARPVPGSLLSLAGLLRHLAEVERYWLREVLHAEDDLPDLWSTREAPDGDFSGASAQTAAADVAAYRAEVDACRSAAATWADLDGPVAGRRNNAELNLRWILTHLIEEYARHLGHADILRELIDGTTGY